MTGSEFASLRRKAERNMKSRIDSILSSAARLIAEQASGITVVSSEAVFAQMLDVRARPIIESAAEEIDSYIRAYSKASITALGDKDTGAVGRMLGSELFGRTLQERTDTYMNYFFRDVVKTVIAGKRLRMKQRAIEDAAAEQFADPYGSGSLVEKAKRKGFNSITPSYGRGIYRSAYGNIVRNAQGVIAVAWGREGRNKARRDGATAFVVHRGSTYPCAVCDAETGTVHPISDDIPPYHVNCCCYVEYIY